MRTLPREPWRGSQICGYQVEIGSWHNGGSRFCGELKAEGLAFCEEHAEDFEANYGSFNVTIPDCVAKGNHRKGVRLLWEPYDGDCPEEPTAEETAAYAALLGAS